MRDLNIPLFLLILLLVPVAELGSDCDWVLVPDHFLRFNGRTAMEIFTLLQSQQVGDLQSKIFHL